MTAVDPRISGKQLVFVYGTLRRGEGNHGVMQGALGRYVGCAEVSGFKLFDLGAFPAVDFDGGRWEDAPRLVQGEVFSLSPEGVARLDQLEGHPNFYRRCMVEVRLTGESDFPLLAWIYVLPGLTQRVRRTFQIPIESGDWIAWRKAKLAADVEAGAFGAEED